MSLFFAMALSLQDLPPLGDVPLGKTPLKLLDDRLTIWMPEGTVDEPRGHSIMGAPQPNTRESRLVWTSGERKIVVMTYELFRTAGKEFESLARKELGSWRMEADVSPSLQQESLRICSVTPKKPDPIQEAVFVLGLFVLREDSTVQYTAFYANPKAAADLPGCTALARKAGESMRSGGRALAREAGARTLSELEGGKKCVIDVPEGYTVTAQRGPDFIVSSISKVTRLGDPGCSLSAYFGHHPRYQFAREDQKPALSTTKGKLLGQDVEWTRWTNSSESKQQVQEAMLEVPASKGLKTHVFLQAPDATGLKELEAMAGSFRIEESK